MTQPQTKDELIRELDPLAKALADKTAAAVQDLIECLALQQAFIAEHKNKFPLYELPGRWRLPIELQGLIGRCGIESENNILQKALIKFDANWGGR